MKTINIYTVTVKESGFTFPCRENETVLAAMQRSGGPIPYGCHGGGCGICRMHVLDGDFEHIKRMSRAHIAAHEEEQGIVLLCCIEPRGNLRVSEDKINEPGD